MTTGWVYDPRFCDHDTGRGHPERPDRLRAIRRRLDAAGLLQRMTALDFEPVDLQWVRQVHDQVYVDRLRAACDAGRDYIDDPDSAICADSYEIALLAAGGALAATDAVMEGRVHNAFCALRPPGHHAERDRSMGFCMFNNVAVTAEYLRAAHHVQRIAVVDFDVHHGNGTQHIFEARPDVLFVSLHEDPRNLYPGMGFAHETGTGDGVGYTINVPMAPASGDVDYQRAFANTVIPALNEFAPNVLLVSAGFDAAAADTLAHIELSTACFGWMAQQLLAVAQTYCDQRMICLLEGGYDLTALSEGVEAVVREMLDAGNRR